ncbi:subtilase-type protease inhibitor [Streptomyces chumphonensis]|uniref:subtilase-type protease inhibitor n=1 Tax=Streptomyces chumphonensis TaxID=1214925 RepID=UPI003D744FEC
MRIPAKLAATGTLITAAVLVPFGGGIAHATPVSQPSQPTPLPAPSALTLTIAHGDSAATTTPERAVTLSCAPDAGTHPDAASACTQLAAANGDFTALPTNPDRFCPMVYDPVVVTAEGVWKGQRVSFERTYGNTCVLSAEDHTVFAF